MKIINKKTMEVVAEIVGGENLTLDEALELTGIEVMKTQEDFEACEKLDWEELDLVPDNFEGYDD